MAYFSRLKGLTSVCFLKVTFSTWLKCLTESSKMSYFFSQMDHFITQSKRIKHRRHYTEWFSQKCNWIKPDCRHNQMKCLKGNAVDCLQQILFFFQGQQCRGTGVLSWVKQELPSMVEGLLLNSVGVVTAERKLRTAGLRNSGNPEWIFSKLQHALKSICAGADSSSHFLRSLTVFFRVHLQLRRFKITDFVLTINVKDWLHYIKPFKTSVKAYYQNLSLHGQQNNWLTFPMRPYSCPRNNWSFLIL